MRRARGWNLVRVFLAMAVLALGTMTRTTEARARDADGSIGTEGASREERGDHEVMIERLKGELGRLRGELSMAEHRAREGMRCEARMRAEVGVRKMAQEEAAKCEEALERERRRTSAADVAKTLASGFGAREEICERCETDDRGWGAERRAQG